MRNKVLLFLGFVATAILSSLLTSYILLRPSSREANIHHSSESVNVTQTNSVSSSSNITESSSTLAKSSDFTARQAAEKTDVDYTTLLFPEGADPHSNLNIRDGFYVLYGHGPEHVAVVQWNNGSGYTDVSILYDATTAKNAPEMANYGPENALTDAKNFIIWLRTQAPSGTTKNGIASNFEYWKTYVKNSD